MLVDLHDCRLIATTVAVVGRGEDGDDVAVVAPIIAFHHKLMGTGDELEPISVVELLRNVLTECVARSARRYAPAATIIGVRPKQVAHWALVGNFLDAVELPDVVQGVQRWRDASVHADDLILNYSSHRKVVEGVCEELPDFGTSVRPDALVKEAVDLGDLPAFVVPTQEGDSLLVPDLAQEHHCDGLHRVVATVHIVSEKKVVRLRQRAANAEELLEI
mmetsp:Transcript_33159/g.72296  ORF Transcript_33159/g.72296 Transcript_33159/m.72296 type:complete len:219 (+) Transcript_33159:322-978(+)